MKYLKEYKLFESDQFDKDRDQLDITKMEDYKNGDYHQAILNLGYFKWQKNGKWSYVDMVDFIGEKYHPEFKMLILLGKYNQQVNNGGHTQYYDNGYATGTGGVFSNKDNIQLHLDMMELFRESRLFNMDEVCKKVYDIMERFKQELQDFNERCDECDGLGYIEEDCYTCNGDGNVESEEYCPECNGDGMIDDEDCSNCDGQGWVESEESCEECGGSGQMDNDCEYCDGGYVYPQIDNLDDEYYEISDKFMQVCNKYSERLINAVIVKPREMAKKLNQ